MVTAVSGAPAEISHSCKQASSKILLRVTNLKVAIRISPDQEAVPVNGVSFEVADGETLGILGESGAGKTTLARSLLRLVPRSGRIEGDIEFDGIPLLSLRVNHLRAIRGDKISLIYQDSSVLNPVRRVGEQLVDVLRAHRSLSREKCREQALSLMQEVGLEPAKSIYSAYPHQLSGGERQRILIAQALICEPSLVIADEPTASVDCDTASQILRLFDGRKEHLGRSIIFISHDVSVLAQVADTILVMNGGHIVERGPAEQILRQPRHPYTRALLKCSDLSKFDRQNRIAGLRLPTITDPLPESPGYAREVWP